MERARPDDSSLPPELEELADEFDLAGEIGRGATAVVYRARDRALDRAVAIKVIRARHLADDEAVHRLEREARLVARFNHANVVTLYSVRRLRHGSLALVMRYVEGETLRAELRRRGPLPAARVRRIAADIARALSAAHAYGVVHRDVKPENVYVEHPTGRALLADFGSAAPTDAVARLTATGITIGTPGYMAPELVDGGDATPRSDVYSLGLVAWEALTGMQPWAGDTLFEVLAFRKQGALPPLAELVPEVPPGLALAVERALRRDPEERWPGASAMLSALVAPDAAPGRRFRDRLMGRRAGAGPALAAGGLASVQVEPASAAGNDLPTVALMRPVATAAPAFRAAPVRRPDAPTPAAPDAPDAAPDPTTALVGVGAPTALDLEDEPDFPEPGATGRPRRLVLGAVGLVAALSLLAYGVSRDGQPAAAASMVASADGDVGRTLAVEVDQDGREATPPLDAPVATTEPAAPAPTRPAIDSGAAPAASPPVATPPVEPMSPVVSGSSSGAAMGALPTELPGPSPTPLPPAATPALPASPSPAPALGAGDRLEARLVAAGGLHSCSVTRAAELLCWGGNERGQLGAGGGRALFAAPTGASLRVRQLSLGLLHSCAVTTAGIVTCWGANDRGQLGDGTRTTRRATDGAPGLADVVTVAVGAAHSCAVTRVGRALCWGANDQGQLGIGHRADREVPSFVSGSVRVTDIVAGWNHTCALAADGTAYCWGRGADGQLGDGGTKSRPHPVPVTGGYRFRALAAGRAHSCGATSRGEVLCWGDNSAGQAAGRRSESPAPTRVAGVSGAIQVAAGSLHSCALTSGGETYCWGQNRYGQLGDGSTAARAAAVRVDGAPAFVALTASGAHSCGITGSGDVYCWGYNLEGQLGDGTRANRSRPVRVRAGA